MGIEEVVQKGVPIVLDRERRLYYNFAAFRMLAEKYGAAMKAVEKLDKYLDALVRKLAEETHIEEMAKLEAKESETGLPTEPTIDKLKAIDEQLLDLDILSLGAEFLDLVVDLVHAGLLHEDPNLTREKVESILDMQNMTAAIGAIRAAVVKHLPRPKEGEEEGDPPKA